MHEIILLRHGKSDWGADYRHDRERPISSRGRRAAATMGRLLTATLRRPDLVLTSPAVRARTTAETAAEAGGWEAPIEALDILYGGGPEAVLIALHGVPADVSRVLLVGHEPAWSEATSMLIGGGDHRVPTGAAVGMETFAPWDSIGPATCRLTWLMPPRLFTDGHVEL